MGYDVDVGNSEQASEDFVDNLIDISDNDARDNSASELVGHGWNEVSPWGATTINATSKNNNLRTKRKKGKIDVKRLTNVDTRASHCDIMPVKTGKDVIRRSYDTLTYDTPTWRFIVDAKTFEYITRSDPVKSQVNDFRRMENKSANFRTHTGNNGDMQPDPAKFFDDQLRMALNDRDMYFTYKSRLMEIGNRFSASKFKNSLKEDKEDTSPISGHDYSTSDRKMKHSIDRKSKMTYKERNQTPVHLRKEAHKDLRERNSYIELKQKVASRELQPKSKIVLNHVRLVKEYDQNRLEDEKKDKYFEKLRKKSFNKNSRGSTVNYPDLGLPVLPRVFGNGNEVGYLKKGLYINSLNSSLKISTANSLSFSSELHLPAIANNVIPEQGASHELWRENTDPLLPPIFGTKMELSIANSNQSLL